MKSHLNYKYYYRRNLPHVQPKDALIFITYRLAFTLPRKVSSELKARKIQFDQKLGNVPHGKRKSLRYRTHQRLFIMEDKILDKNEFGPNWLKDKRIASIVLDSLHFSNGKKYNLKCALVMPNHVHVVLKPLRKFGGGLILYSRDYAQP